MLKCNTVTTVQLETIFPEFSNFQWKASLPYLGMLFLFNNWASNKSATEFGLWLTANAFYMAAELEA